MGNPGNQRDNEPVHYRVELLFQSKNVCGIWHYHPKTFEEMSLDVGNIDIRSEIWRDFCGVSIRSQHYQVFEKFMHIIADQIKKDIPVGVTLDSNYVPWNRHFQIRPHCLLICGISEHSDEFICCDGDFHVEKRWGNLS